MILKLCVVLLSVAALGLAPAALAAPDDAYKFLVSTGKTGVAQNVGLDAAKKSEVEGIANDLAGRTGAKAYIVLLKRDEDPGQYVDLYDRLNMKGKDVLIASNGTRWEVKVAALGHDAKQAAVDRALAQTGANPIARMRLVSNELSTALSQVRQLSWNEFQTANAGKHWSSGQMSAAYEQYKTSGVLPGQTGSTGTAMTTQPYTPLQQTSQSHTGTWIFLGVLVGAIVGIVFWRRRKRDAGLGAELKELLRNPEQVLADVVLNMDGLENHPRFGQLMDSYTACENKLKELRSASPTRETLARARSLNDEANRVRRQFDEAKMQR